MKKVLLIGDSIRLSYQPRVTELLKDNAVVSGPADNCRFSSYTLFNLSSWAPDNDYDVIQWNNGQWDNCLMPDGKIHTPLTHYLDIQKRIAAILKTKARRLIFATTTPVWPEQFTSGSIHPRRNEDIIACNQAAVNQLAGSGIEITDLHKLIFPDIKRYICSDMVHLTEEGKELCATHAAAMIRHLR